jgi:hypothetical protein
MHVRSAFGQSANDLEPQAIAKAGAEFLERGGTSSAIETPDKGDG